MKLFVPIALIVSIVVGMLPIFIAKTTDQGDEICDPEKFYAPVRECVVLWDRAFIYFIVYFLISVIFFCVVYLLLRLFKFI